MNLILVRHGQAGTRLAYDVLSETGSRQAALLGAHLDRVGLRFSHWRTGGLQRQRDTARQVHALQSGATPQLVEDPAWNEFDLDQVYQGIGPKLAAVNPAFRTHWESVQAEMERHGANAEANVNRRWSPADEMVVRAWVSGQVEYAGESWRGFCERIRGALQTAAGEASDSASADGLASMVVFTSATPAAICAGAALGLDDAGIFQLAGALLNSSYTELRWRRGQWRLFSFNNVPHLADRALHTHR